MSRRKQSNPKPLKSGEEETGTEDDKTVVKTTFEDPTISSKNTASTTCEGYSLPSTLLKKNELSTIIKKESVEFEDNNRSDESNFGNNSSPENDHKPKTTMVNVIKNEPDTSSLLSNLAAIDEQDHSVTASNSQSIRAESIKFYHKEINTAATDKQYKNETLDIRQGFLCPPCGIRFSSPSTLKAHQTHYCSHRPNDKNKDGTMSEDEDGYVLFTCGSFVEDGGNGVEYMKCNELSTKSAKTGKQYCCSHCSYSADKKVSLNRHMRMHSTSPTSSVQNDSDSPIPPVDRYCQECDIRFSNLKTFRAHKLHYCRTRNVIKRASNANFSSSSDSLIDSRTTTSLPFDFPKYSETQPFIALPTDPVLIVPYSLIQAGNLLSGPITSALSSQNGVYLVLSDGNIQMVTQGVVKENIRVPEASSPVLQPLLVANNSHVRSHYKVPVEEEGTYPNKDMKTLPATTSNGALDLRMHHEPSGNKIITHVGTSEEEKENCFHNEQTNPEDIVCAPSIPIMVSTLSNSSTPSLSPSSPRSPSTQKRPDKVIGSNSKKRIKKVINNSTSLADNFDNKTNKNDNISTQNTAFISGNYNATKMLVATSTVEPRFTSEMISHVTPIQQMGLVKKTTLNPTSNMPLSLPQPISSVSTMTQDLIDPAILTLLNSELARHLATGSSAPNTPQYGRQGAWKCENCNIGFCKYKNYVAHKKHYCSTREVRDSTQSPDNSSKTSPIRSPSPKVIILSPAISQSLAKENSSPDHQSLQPSSSPPLLSSTKVIQNNDYKSTFSQFACTLCGIKYSSLDNLTTHQTFYCPNRSTAALGGVVEKFDLKCCTKCKIMLPCDQLLSHECIGTSVTTSWKCPCCFITCHSTSTIQKHFESHTSLKTFHCTICNYKGNTIRGMRSHIRLHFDKQNSDIIEENYIRCSKEDPINEISLVEDNSNKNIRKKLSLEKIKRESLSENKTSPASLLMMASTVLEKSSLPMEVDDEEEDEYIEIDELPILKTELIKNNKISTAVAPEEEKSIGNGSVSSKLEYRSPEQEIDNQLTNNNKKDNSKYCKSCNISFRYLPTYLAHKKFYCSSQSSNGTITSFSDDESAVVSTNTCTAAHTV